MAAFLRMGKSPRQVFGLPGEVCAVTGGSARSYASTAHTCGEGEMRRVAMAYVGNRLDNGKFPTFDEYPPGEAVVQERNRATTGSSETITFGRNAGAVRRTHPAGHARPSAAREHDAQAAAAILQGAGDDDGDIRGPVNSRADQGPGARRSVDGDAACRRRVDPSDLGVIRRNGCAREVGHQAASRASAMRTSVSTVIGKPSFSAASAVTAKWAAFRELRSLTFLAHARVRPVATA